MADIFTKIKIQSPVDQIAHQLRSLITSGDLNPDDVLPSERKLADKFGVGRLTVRAAIKKLEFYGLVKTTPQSGTTVIGNGLFAFEGLITEILSFEQADFASLVDTRNTLEIKSAGVAAKKRTEQDIIMIQKALDAFEDKIKQGKPTEEEDFLLHLQIAEASKNSVLKLLMRIITPDILKKATSQNTDNANRKEAILKEHQEIVKQIIAQDAKGAKNAMRLHLRGTPNL